LPLKRYLETLPLPLCRGPCNIDARPQAVVVKKNRLRPAPLWIPGNIGQPSYGPLHILAQLPPDMGPRLFVVAVAPAEYLRYHAAFGVALLQLTRMTTNSFIVSGSKCQLLPRVLPAELFQSAEDGIGHLSRSGRAIQIRGPDLRLAEHLLDGRDHARSGVLVPEVI